MSLFRLSALIIACSFLPLQAQTYRITGPFTHANLDIFLVHAPNEPLDRKTLSLQEAMQSKKVVVYETAQVNDLAIENTSGEPVYIQAGDIVKGGQQDRVLSDDLLLPPHSGRISIAAFCVEHGRWSQRGAESQAEFSSSNLQVATKSLKTAVLKSKDQNEVWRQVASAQQSVAETTASASASDRFVRADGVGLGFSPTSMALTLDSKVVKSGAEPYLADLRPLATRSHDVIGYAYAINGKLAGADLYPTHELFVKLWPKLLNTSSVEAAFNPAKELRARVAPADVEALLKGPKTNPTARSIQNRVRISEREDGESFATESRDAIHPESWLHRTFLTK